MAEVLLGQQPVITLQDTPIIIGTNDGTVWQSEADFAFVALRTELTQQDRAGAYNVAPAGPVSAARLRAVGNFDSFEEGVGIRLAWRISAPTWSLNGHFDMLDEGENNFGDWTFTNSDPAVTYGGAFSGGINWSLFSTDLANEDVLIDAMIDTALADGQVALHAFTLYVTEGGRTFVHQFPSDYASTWGGAAQIYPPPKTDLIIGGHQ